MSVYYPYTFPVYLLIFPTDNCQPEINTCVSEVSEMKTFFFCFGNKISNLTILCSFTPSEFHITIIEWYNILEKKVHQQSHWLEISFFTTIYPALYMYVTFPSDLLYKWIIASLLQINDNGIISIDNRYNSHTPQLLPVRDNAQRIIAPYWADVDTRGSGNIYYRQTTDPDLLARATTEIRANFPNAQKITIRNLLIATWDEVGYYYYGHDKVTYVTRSAKRGL